MTSQAKQVLVTVLLLLASVRSLPSRKTNLLPAKILKSSTNNANTQPQRAGQDRQIQPLSCSSQTTGEVGVCMFAWNCVEAGGHHLGTCIDRFYFGSCCKLPDVIATNELGPGQAPEGIVPVNLDDGLGGLDVGHKPQVDAPADVIGNVEQLAAPVDVPTPDTTPAETTTSSTTESTTATTEPTTTATESTTTATLEITTTSSETTTSTTTTTTTEEVTTTTNAASAVDDAVAGVGGEAVPDVASSTEVSGSDEQGQETSTEAETTPSSASEDVTSSGDPEVTSSSSESSSTPVQEAVEAEGTSWVQITSETSSVSGPGDESVVSTSEQSSVGPPTGPEQPVAPPIVPGNLTDLVGQTGEEKPLRNMTRFEACGRRPWFSVKNHELLYPSGVRNGPSEAPIGQTVGTQRRMSGRRNSKFLQSWNRKGRIVNGQTADYGEWPWQVSLRQWRTATYLHKCGCALLSENWAITAAHCVENVSPDDLLLRMGEYDLNSMSEPHQHVDRKVQIVASHPKFDPKTFEYDLALLRFYEPVEYQPNVVPICIPEDDKQLVGESAWVTGWGRLYEDGPLPSVMQEVDLPVINNTMCERMYRDAGYVEHIPSIFICAGYAAGGKDSCEGDSGGPMVVQRPDGRFMLSGVISWGIGCAEKNQPGVYTRISEFREWINQILQF